MKDPLNPQQKIEVWGEIWRNIGDDVEQSIKMFPQIAEVSAGIRLTGNPFVSTGKVPQHAIRYALGKSLADINRDKRIDSRYDGEARPKYELIGKVHWFIHSVKDYLAESPNDVLLWHKKRYLSLHYKLFNEAEVAFIGGIQAKYHMGSVPIVQPRLDIAYDPDYHFNLFGLTNDRYEYFRQGFQAAQRPSHYGIDVFGGAYNARLINIFNLTEVQFAEYQKLIALINACIARNEKTIPLDQLLPYREYLLKEINIKYGEQVPRTTFYGKKNDKYWYRPTENVDVNQLLKFVQKNLRNRSPYRKLKNELREHLMGFYAEKMHQIALNHTKKSGKVLVYRAPDGLFKRLPQRGGVAQLKKDILKNVKPDKSGKITKDKSKENDLSSKIGFFKLNSAVGLPTVKDKKMSALPNVLVRNKEAESFLQFQCCDFLDRAADMSVRNSAAKKFIGTLSGQNELTFECWLSRDSVSVLLPLVMQKINANVMTFCALDGGQGIATYSSQIRIAVQKAREARKSLFVISKEPIVLASHHYVLTIFHKERIYFIDPTGQVRNGFCNEFKALADFFDMKNVPLLASRTKLQNDPQENGLVSCGVICLALCEFFAQGKNLEKLEEIGSELEDRKSLRDKSDEKDIYFLYNEFRLDAIFPSLVPPEDKNYQSCLVAYRAKFYALLNELDESQIEKLREFDRELLELIQNADIGRDDVNRRSGPGYN